MNQKDVNHTIFTTLSGVVGGSAAMASETSTADFTKYVEVIIFTAISALTAYLVKIAADYLRRKIFKNKSK